MAGVRIYEMKKIFVDKIDGDCVLTGEDHLHVSVVMRAKKGDKITLCTGDGFDYNYEIAGFDRNSTKLRFIDKTEVETEPTCKVDLFVALTKSDKLEYVTQKCTELGINDIHPFMSEFVQVKRESLRLDRLNKIAKEAAQQCGRGKVPKVSEAIDFDEMLALLSGYDSVMFFYEGGGGCLKGAVKGKSVAVIVGSEGGFGKDEAKRIQAANNAYTVSLGKRILRAETASVVATALVMYESGELQ